MPHPEALRTCYSVDYRASSVRVVTVVDSPSHPSHDPGNDLAQGGGPGGGHLAGVRGEWGVGLAGGDGGGGVYELGGDLVDGGRGGKDAWGDGAQAGEVLIGEGVRYGETTGAGDFAHRVAAHRRD